MNRLDPERAGRIQDSDPTFLVEFFFAPIIIGFIVGVLLFVYLPDFKLTAFAFSLILGIVGGFIISIRVKRRKGNSKYYLPIEDTNDINDWNVRDHEVRKDELERLKTIVKNELESFKNKELVDKFLSWDKNYYEKNRIYDKNDLENYKKCWVVYETYPPDKCISFCEDVFPKVGNWAIHKRKDMFLGKPMDWFPSLEMALKKLYSNGG